MLRDPQDQILDKLPRDGVVPGSRLRQGGHHPKLVGGEFGAIVFVLSLVEGLEELQQEMHRNSLLTQRGEADGIHPVKKQLGQLLMAPLDAEVHGVGSVVEGNIHTGVEQAPHHCRLPLRRGLVHGRQYVECLPMIAQQQVQHRTILLGQHDVEIENLGLPSTADHPAHQLVKEPLDGNVQDGLPIGTPGGLDVCGVPFQQAEAYFFGASPAEQRNLFIGPQLINQM
mmetsp:Transcript_115280/g.200674  ORF Transcript_115280/g.200674 Transcript_115280/m.200674 type:complete len:227 (-) Transcript_115280:571-1251(-)